VFLRMQCSERLGKIHLQQDACLMPFVHGYFELQQQLPTRKMLSKHSLHMTCTVFFPSGSTINLAKELPGLFSTGKVYCPLPETVCPTLSCGSSSCGPNADCWQGTCKCHMGFAGESGSTAEYYSMVEQLCYSHTGPEAGGPAGLGSMGCFGLPALFQLANAGSRCPSVSELPLRSAGSPCKPLFAKPAVATESGYPSRLTAP
jgi:hypothetical protein